MADVINRVGNTIIVLNTEETDELANLVSNYVNHLDGESILFDLASGLAGGFIPPVRADWHGLAELEMNEIREEQEERWRG